MSTKPLINLPQGIDVRVEQNTVVVKGPKAELKREFPIKLIDIVCKDGTVEVKAKNKSASTRAIVGAFKSHIQNMITGTQAPYVYTLKVAYVHFPMTVEAKGAEFQIVNFLGEKKPRKIKIPAGVKVSVQGDLIKVESSDIELAGKTASLIESATRISGRDRRVFQDGVYIIQKGK